MDDFIKKHEEINENEKSLIDRDERKFSEKQIREINDFESERISNDEKENIADISEVFEHEFPKLNKLKKFSKILFIISCILFVVCIFVFIYESSMAMSMAEFIETKKIIMTMLFGFILVAAVLSIASRRSYNIYMKNFNEKFVIPITKRLIEPHKFSKNGISRDFFEDTDISMDYDYPIFKSSNKISGMVDDKEFVLSQVSLKNISSSNNSLNSTGFNGIFLKSQNSNFFNKVIIIREKNSYDEELAEKYEDEMDKDNDISRLSDEEVYEAFSTYYEIIVDDEVCVPQEFEIDFFREFMKLDLYSEYLVSYSFVANTFCIMINHINELISEKNFAQSKIVDFNDIREVENLFLKKLNFVKKCYEIAQLFQYKK